MISVIIPAYSGEKTIPELTDRIGVVLESMNQEYEFIIVFDGGDQATCKKLIELKDTYSEKMKLIILNKNYGQHNAIICGMEYVSGSIIVTIDEDFQHSPEDVKVLITKQKELDSDVVYAVFKKLKHNWFRNATSKLLRKVLSKTIKDLHPDYSSFRVMKREICDQLLKMDSSFTFIDGYISWVTNNVATQKVEHSKGLRGKSSYTLGKLVLHSLNILITFSNLPIRVLSISSISVFLITLIYSTYILFRKWLIDDFLLGFPTVMIVMGVSLSLILLGMSVLGEYLSRISGNVVKKPKYTVKKVL